MKDGQLAALGSIIIACMDRATQRSRPLPAELLEKLETIAGAG